MRRALGRGWAQTQVSPFLSHKERAHAACRRRLRPIPAPTCDPAIENLHALLSDYEAKVDAFLAGPFSKPEVEQGELQPYLVACVYRTSVEAFQYTKCEDGRSPKVLNPTHAELTGDHVFYHCP